MKPSITQTCNIPGLTQPHSILWMIAKNEKSVGRNMESYFKFQDMLKENEVTMVLTVAKPEKIPYVSTILKLVKNKDKQWHVILKWDPKMKRML